MFNKANLIDGKVPETELDISAAIVTGLDAAISANTDVAAATSHLSNTSNPHSVTKSQVGLSNVPNIDCTNASNIISGTIPNAVLPPLAITTVQTAVSEVAQLALTTQEGDIVIRSDISKSYVRNAGTAGNMTDFNELLSPTGSVISVNSQTGVVVLTTNDVTDFSNKRYVTDAQQTILGNTSGTNSGDNAVNSLYSGLTQYTNEDAQDAIGAMVDSTITYIDGTPLLSRAALSGAIIATSGSNTTTLGSFTKSQLDSAISDGNAMYLGDAPTSHTHSQSDITNLTTDLGNKQATLVSGTNIKTVNGSTLLGSGDVVISGGGSLYQTEVDFGATPIQSSAFVIAHIGASAASLITASLAYSAPTGKDLDELEMDDLIIKAGNGATNSFELYITSTDGSYLADKFKINYLIT